MRESLEEQVAAALLNKAAALRAAGLQAETKAVYDDILSRFADAPEAVLRDLAAEARTARAEL